MWCTSNGLVHVHCYDFTILRLQSICLIFSPSLASSFGSQEKSQLYWHSLELIDARYCFHSKCQNACILLILLNFGEISNSYSESKMATKNFLLKFYVKEENVHKLKSSWVVSRNIQGNGLYTGGNYTGGNYRQLLTIRCKLGTVLPILFSLYITGSRCRLELLPQNIKMHISRSSLPSGKILSATCEQV